jgi:mRNA interferase MazF
LNSQLLKCGDVVFIDLPFHNPKGREQEGRRPAVIIGVPLGDVRYPVVVVVPLTTQFGGWAKKNPALYQIRAVDTQRVIGYLGSLSVDQYLPIIDGVRQILDL